MGDAECRRRAALEPHFEAPRLDAPRAAAGGDAFAPAPAHRAVNRRRVQRPAVGQLLVRARLLMKGLGVAAGIGPDLFAQPQRRPAPGAVFAHQQALAIRAVLQRHGARLAQEHGVPLRRAQRNLRIVAPSGALVVGTQDVPRGRLLAVARTAQGAGDQIQGLARRADERHAGVAANRTQQRVAAVVAAAIDQVADLARRRAGAQQIQRQVGVPGSQCRRGPLRRRRALAFMTLGHGGHQRVQHRRADQPGQVTLARDQLTGQVLVIAIAVQARARIAGQRRAVEFADDLAARQRLAFRHQLVQAVGQQAGRGNRGHTREPPDIHRARHSCDAGQRRTSPGRHPDGRDYTSAPHAAPRSGCDRIFLYTGATYTDAVQETPS